MDEKSRTELEYWKNLSSELASGCDSRREKGEALLAVCWKKTFPRYLDSLGLTPESFRGLRVLDLGCGPHGGLIGFRQAEAHGADHLIVQYIGLGYPLVSHGIRYASAKSEALPYEDCTFDVVISVNSLDHVDHLERTVREIGRVMKPGGRFVGQLNFHIGGRPTEPINLDHVVLLELFGRNGLKLTEIRHQGWEQDAAEHRFFYSLAKRAELP